MSVTLITKNTTQQNGATADNQYSGVVDAKITESDPTSNFGSSADLEITKFNTNDHNHSLFRFDDITNIAATDIVSTATLYLYQTAASGAYSVDIRRILQAFTEAGCTWTTYDGTNNWNTSGAEGAGTDRESTVQSTTSIAATTGAYYAIDVTAIVQDIVDGTIASDEGFHGEMNGTGGASDFKVFASGNGADGQRPELVITHAAGGGGTILPFITKYFKGLN